MRLRSIVRFLTAAAGGLSISCGPPSSGQGRVHIPVAAPPASRVSDESEPRILSAHIALERAVQLGDGDGILVVFSEEVDPASLVPQMLLVVSEAGRRSPPERALLSPASERDENRSVLLVGEFSEAEDAPGDVLVVGPLFTEGGVSLRGLSREIEPVDAPGRVVLAERIRTEDDTCAGARQVVRTYWTDVLRGVEAADLEGVRVSLGSGAEVKPMAFDDHAEGGDRGHDGEDNVLDLCLRDDDPARELRIEPGVFEDAAGHPSDAVEIAIVAPRLRRP